MRKSFAAVAALLFSATFASAAIIDDFTAPPAGTILTQTVVGTTGPQTVSGLGASVIGGARALTVTISNISGGGSTGSASIKLNNPTPGAAELNSDSNTDATDLFGYGTTADLNANLTAGGLSDAFVIRLLLTDLASVTNANSITVGTTGTGTSTATFTIPALVGNGNPTPLDVVVPYASFIGSANFADIDNISFAINGPRSSDYTLDFLGTNTVPEPASMGLLAAGTLGVLARRKR